MKNNVKNRSTKRKIAIIPAVLICCLFISWLFTACNFSKTFDKEKITDIPEIQYINFPIDDCNGIFEDLTDNKDSYNSIFDQSILGFLKTLHDEYGAVFSLYVFYDWDLSAEGFDLSMTTDQYQAEFQANSDWLKFGFHASDAKMYERLDPNEIKEYYEKTIQELIRITGNTACLDLFVRLDRYTANEDMLRSLRNVNYPVEGLLIADRADALTRASYNLSEDERAKCYAEDWYVDSNGIAYTPTDLRAEAITDDEYFYEHLNSMLSQDNLIVFTHEWAMNDNENVCRYLT